MSRSYVVATSIAKWVVGQPSGLTPDVALSGQMTYSVIGGALDRPLYGPEATQSWPKWDKGMNKIGKHR